MPHKNTPLVLGTPKSAWSVSPHHGSQVMGLKTLRDKRKKILTRDAYTCQACGWISRQWQEIHHRNHDHSDHSEKNLETLCPLCHQVFHLPQAAATNGGTIIWLPEVSQAELNLMCTALFVALRHPKGKWAASARAILGIFESRAAVAEDFLGRSNPGFLAQSLLRVRPDQFEKRAHLTRALRLLPHPSRFQSEIEYWEKAHFPEQESEAWAQLLPEHLDPARGGLSGGSDE